MAGSRSSRRHDDDEDDDEDEPDEDEDDEAPPRRRSKSSSRRGRRPSHRPPVQRWRAGDEDEEEEEEEAPTPPLPWRKKPIYWRARDSLFFEPLVALAIIVVLLVSLWAYTQNWPPVYVVESNSMQHGPNDRLGLINAGDMVLAEKIPIAQITTYMQGLPTGYSTYGESGDVVLYWPNGQGSTPVIHRALLYLQWDPPNFYNASIPNGLPCGNVTGSDYAYFSVRGGPATCSTTQLDGYLQLYHVGWDSQTVQIDLTPSVAPSTLGDHSGFLTMGDNNSEPDQTGPNPISSLVQPNWVLGVARGMIPWFGALKLLLDGNAGHVPTQSWELMGLTIVGVILVAFGIHYALRREGIETPLRRKEEEEEQAEAEEAEAESPPKRRWFPWPRRRTSDDDDDSDEGPTRRRTRSPPSHTSSRRGRPVPHVRRAEKPKRKPPSTDDEDEEL